MGKGKIKMSLWQGVGPQNVLHFRTAYKTGDPKVKKYTETK